MRTLLRSVAILIAGDARLREDYRRTAGDGATASEEERFVRASKKVAAWLVLWGLVAPMVISLGVQPLLPPQPPWGYVLRVVIWFFVCQLVLLVVQARLRFLLEKNLQK